ncbi:hypothetical protein NSB25_20950 [Acetatifactor muris]|uniref:DNA ligase n=1 Tax=Acetatifactor muris TaxID=879566 RepID=A0A2K4ZLX4_9FIRM|nr:hypothetical protein [Acetatifactor muris]MCR2049727.1 hypothetical protein [Acetatifactor muris]SOY31471.1 DNA ligase [Acetatifactor muris]
MVEVINLFKQIQETNSLNNKKAIITANKDNELFKMCLKFLLDGNIVTGISTKKIKKKVMPSTETAAYFLGVYSTFENVMDYLSKNNTGKDEDIYEIQAFLFGHEDDREFYEQLITKKFRLGVDEKLVNKCIPRLIDTWEVQLGASYDKLKLREEEWFALSQKMNGNRASFYQGKLISRQGKEFTGMKHIISDLKQLGMGWFYDGELIRKNFDNLPDGENFRIGTGIINSDAESKEEIKFVIFDYFPEEEILNKQSSSKYKVRRKMLNALGEVIKEKKLQNIEIVTMVYEGTDQSQIMKWLDYAVEQGWEGLMLNKDALYKCKRTTDLIKIKRFYSMDLPVIKVLEGDGRLKGTLGALVVKYKDNTVNVGSGFDDETRTKFWKDRDNLIGRVVEVKYKEISKDKKTGLESLQFPIYIGLREIGKSISYD